MAGPEGTDQTAPAEEAPAEPTQRVVLGLAYDGAGFHGFAAQPGQRTVAGELAAVLAKMGAGEIQVTCAGRTDAGVHATAQVVHVDLPVDFIDDRLAAAATPGGELPKLAEALSAQLGSEIVVWRALIAPDGFNARRSALSRRYRYSIDFGPRRDPLRRDLAWYLEVPLDLAAMRLAADTVLGEHDFASFCRRPPGDKDGPIFRRVNATRWSTPAEGRLCFDIEANAFCHQMVRSLVGAFVAVGRWSLRPSDILSLLDAKSRAGAPNPAPAKGLCLVAVRYPEALTGYWE